jgi:hypothetical protein
VSETLASSNGAGARDLSAGVLFEESAGTSIDRQFRGIGIDQLVTKSAGGVPTGK